MDPPTVTQSHDYLSKSKINATYKDDIVTPQRSLFACKPLPLLEEGYLSRQHLDNPLFCLKQNFQTIAFAFNNEQIFLELPDEAYNIVGIEYMSLNHFARIKKQEIVSCKLSVFYYKNMQHSHILFSYFFTIK